MPVESVGAPFRTTVQTDHAPGGVLGEQLRRKVE